MATLSRQQPAWQGHKHTESTDSETSFFDESTASTVDSWSGYFEGWNDQSHDSYCPEIASASSSPARSAHSSASSDTTTIVDTEELLPSAYPRRSRPTSVRRHASFHHLVKPAKKSRRFGIISGINEPAGDAAAARLDQLLQDPMSNTEDILAAMSNSDWDVASLQKWYHQSSRSPADLALFKIMFSLRYTPDEPSPLPT